MKGAAKIAHHKKLAREVSAEKDRCRREGEVGALRLTRAQFASIHPDYRGSGISAETGKTTRSALVLATGGTTLVPVEIVP